MVQKQEFPIPPDSVSLIGANRLPKDEQTKYSSPDRHTLSAVLHPVDKTGQDNVQQRLVFSMSAHR